MAADLGKRKNISVADEEGQAIFELLVFLPVFLFLFVVIYNIGNSINISINQQKATRRYFYYIQKGNSFLPSNSLLTQWKSKGFTYAGLTMMGFQNDQIADQPIAPCFKFPTFLSGATDEVCEDKMEDQQSNFIKIMTAYGICGETFRLTDEGFWNSEFSNGQGIQNRRSSNTSCMLAN